MRCPHCSRRIGGGIPNSIPESQRRTIEERVIALTDDVARDHFLAEGRRDGLLAASVALEEVSVIGGPGAYNNGFRDGVAACRHAVALLEKP